MVCVMTFFFFKQKTAYELRISDWSSDVCSSDLLRGRFDLLGGGIGRDRCCGHGRHARADEGGRSGEQGDGDRAPPPIGRSDVAAKVDDEIAVARKIARQGTKPRRRRWSFKGRRAAEGRDRTGRGQGDRSEEHTSELQSLMRNSYAVFRLNK